MNASLLNELELEPDLLREPETGSNRFVVWLRNGSDETFAYWQRIATPAKLETVADDRVRAIVAASLINGRAPLKPGALGRLRSLLGQTKLREFKLPDGRIVEQQGERQSVLLVVTHDEGGELLNEVIQSRWPSAPPARQLGPMLHLVEVQESRAASRQPEEQPETETKDTAKVSPRAGLERALATARAGGDAVREAVALTDLGILELNEGQAQKAVYSLELALVIVRRLANRDAEYDILGNLGMAAIALRKPDRARELFHECLAYARSRGDEFAEKTNLERLGLAVANMGQFRQATDYFEQALIKTRAKGDRQQEANLLWFQAVQFAELGDREAAIRKGDEAVAVSRILGRPQAAVLGSYLQKYRMGLAEGGLPGQPSAGATATRSAESLFGGAIVTSTMGSEISSSTGSPPPAPASLLKQALSATKAMANYVGSGFKNTPTAQQRKRVEICAGCEHHTGTRCRVCGCFTEIKSRMLHETCPIGKWPR
jgi:tetratricopeptide (TPR) repeat protein